MYPTRIKHKTPKDLFSLWFTDGERTSVTINRETFDMSIGNGLPLLSDSHTFYNEGMSTYRNIMPCGECLSIDSVNDAIIMLWSFRSIPDTIITGSDATMIKKVREIVQHFNIKMGWNLKHIVCPQLKYDKRYRWFLIDSRKSTAHYKKLPAGFSEICVFTPDWIVGSLSETMPIT